MNYDRTGIPATYDKARSRTERASAVAGLAFGSCWSNPDIAGR